MTVLRWALVGCVATSCSDRAAPTAPPSPGPATSAPRLDSHVDDAAPLPPEPPPEPPPPEPVDVNLLLTPACDDDSTEPSTLLVALSLPTSGRPVFRLDDEVMGTPGMVALITAASAEDSHGPVPLVRRMRAGALELVPSRSTTGVITFRYRARSIATTETGAREGLRHDATGIGGHGRHFLVLPDSRTRYSMRVSWGAPQCRPAITGDGTSTFSETTGELSTLREAAYFWGRPQHAAFDDGAFHLRILWFGAPHLDVAAASAWAARVRRAERAFFGDDDPAPFTIVVRVLASHADRANGIAQETSLLSTVGPRTTFARRLEVNLAHEMLHRWLGLRLRLRGPEGRAYWFTEGFTVHYSNLIAFRAGLLSVDEFLESINDIATRHFDNKRAGASNDAIRRGFYRDPDLAIVPYTRGALYAAELDAALRKASHGTLDGALLELYKQSRGLDGLPADAVRRLVQAKLGRAGLERYDAVIEHGGPPEPPANAYGPCFTRKPRAPHGFTWVRVPGPTDAQCRAW